MRSTTARTLSVLTSLALFAGAVGFVSLASAESGGPTVVLSSTSATTTNSASIPVTITFSEPVSGFTVGDLTTTNATVSGFSGTGANYSFDLIPAGDGTVSALIVADVATAIAPPSKDNQASNTLTFTSDTTGPVISGIFIGTGTSTATVNWTTDEGATGQIFYGLTPSYSASTTVDSSLTTSHTMTLTGLASGTTYHYQIRSMDEVGNLTIATDATFTTTAPADVTAPVISAVSVSPTTTSATVTWTTDEGADGQVAYGLTSAYTASTTLAAGFTTSHTATISGLTPATTYHYQIRSADAALNMGTTTDSTFTTSAVVLTAPVISNVSATGTGTSTETVTWNTDAAATGQVYYGTSASYGSSTALNAVASTSHSAALSGLSEGTLYHYIVVSTNAGGTATSSDKVFTTNSTASTTPLAVTGIDSISTTATANGTFASGWKWIIHFVVPTNETSFRMKFADFTTPSSSSTIPVAGNVRYYSAQSTNATTSSSAIVETNNDYGGALTLTGDTSTTTPGRQIDVTVETAVPVGTPTGVYSTIFGARSE